METVLEHDHAKLRNIWAERMKARMDEKEASCTERDTLLVTGIY